MTVTINPIQPEPTAKLGRPQTCANCNLPTVADDPTSAYFAHHHDEEGFWLHESCDDAQAYASTSSDDYQEFQFTGYVQELQDRERETATLLESAKKRHDDAYNELVAVLQPEKWRELFHSREQVDNAPEITFAIDQFLQDYTITVLGGLPGHAKSLIALASTKSLLEGTPLFGQFEVKRKADRVLYLVPEASITTIKKRLTTFKLINHLGDRLFVRTLSADGDVTLSDPRLLEAAKGADIILDTGIRFLPDDVEENNAADMRRFSKLLFDILKAGARTVLMLHHSPKFLNGPDSKDLTLENCLRGSGDLGAMCGAAWGAYQVHKPSTTVYLKCVKARDFQEPVSLLISGRPSLDETGQFAFISRTDDDLKAVKRLFAPAKPAGRPVNPDRDAKLAVAKELQAAGYSQREIGKKIGMSQGAVSNLLHIAD
jgi:hypothetical protein